MVMFRYSKLYKILLSILCNLEKSEQPTQPNCCDVVNGGDDGDELIIHPLKGKDDPIPDVLHTPCNT